VKKIPVGGCGRINDPTIAETALEEGKVDMVAFNRASLADPEIVNKASEGRIDDIRACMACCQGCLGNLFVGLPITCVLNPALGREKEWGIGTLKPAETRKRVLVVGGGPAGLEAARVATLRGHEVSLYEKEKDLGGQVNLGAKLPGREEFGGFIRWYKIQLEKLGVKIVLGKEVTPEIVNDEKPDVVVVATGATSIRTGMQGFTLKPITGWKSKNVVTVEDLLKGTVKAGENIIILDDNGGIEPTGIADLLTDSGSKVEILTRMPFVGRDLATNAHLPHIYGRILSKGVTLTPNTFIKEITDSSVTAFNIYTGNERRIENVNTAVLVTGKEPNDKLYKQLKGTVKELYRAGDCVAPRKIDSAIFEGYKIGRSI